VSGVAPDTTQKRKMNNKKNKINPELVSKVWFEKSKEDLKSAKVMLEAHRFTWCAFICQQAIEKYLKGVYVSKYKKIPPYIHKLERLCEELKITLPQDLFRVIVDIDKYYISARYPSYKEVVAIKDYKTAENIYNKTKEIIKWLKEEIKPQ